MNKGLRLLFCRECNRKRYCKSIPIFNTNFKKVCSKGHSWIIPGITLERIDAAIKNIFTPDKLKKLFERDNTFYEKLRK